MYRKAIYALILAAALAGLNGLIIKQVTSMTAGSIAWVRAFVPALVFSIWMLQKKVPFFRGNYKKMLGASAINALRMYLYLTAYILTSIGNAVIIFYIWPIFVALLGMLFLKEKLSKYQVFLIILAFIGLIIAYSHKTFTFEDRDFIGMLASLGAAIGYAITVIIFKSESQNYDKNETIFYQNIVSVLVFLPLFLLGYPAMEWGHFGIASIYGLLVGVVVFSLFFYGLKYLNAATTSSMMYLEVVSALILGHLVLKESLELNMILGGILIILSSFLLTRSHKKENAS
ncbi:DMT family transporter [Spongiimicrobium salis]|uniref:DMT family transporter n=1 Tax=Spongiimicrobium salis TaxID=1667022 RepID=UPI00374CCF43